MNAEKFTQKSIEAVREAQECAIRNQNMQIDQQHLLYALLNQEGGLIPQLMKKLHIDAARMSAACDREIQRIPKVSGPGREADKVYISQSVDGGICAQLIQNNSFQAYNVPDGPENEFSVCDTVFFGWTVLRGEGSEGVARAVADKPLVTGLKRYYDFDPDDDILNDF